MFRRSSYDPRKLKLAPVNWPGNVCPDGHKCFECIFRFERYCDNCTELIALGTSGERCKLCFFDLCANCVDPPKNWHAVENSGEPEEMDVKSERELELAVAPDVSHDSTPAAAALQQASMPSTVPAPAALPRPNRMKLRKATQASPAPTDLHDENDIAPQFPIVSTTTPRGASVAGSVLEIILISSQSSQEAVGASAPLVASRAAIIDSIAPAPFVASRTEINVSSLEEWGLWGF